MREKRGGEKKKGGGGEGEADELLNSLLPIY